MSRVEPDLFLNDRYAAMEERLAVGPTPSGCVHHTCGLLQRLSFVVLQVVRKKLNKPLTLAEKVGFWTSPMP